MADEYQLQAEVCGGTTWWMNPPIRSSMMFGSSPCSSAGITNLDWGSFGWPTTDFLDIKATKCSPEDQSHESANSDGSSSIVIQDLQKPNNQQQDSANGSINSALQFIASSLGLPSPTTDWDSSLIHGGGDGGNGRPDQQTNNYQNSSMKYRQEISGGLDQNCTSNDQIQNNFATPSFPMNPVSYGYSSNLLQTLFDSEPQLQQVQEPLYTNRAMNYQTSLNNNELPASLPKFSPLQKLQLPNNLPFSATARQNFCSGSSAAALNDLRASFLIPTQPQFLSSTFSEKANLPSLTAKANSDEVVQGIETVAKKSGSEPAFKRARIETPTPLPTFKVRKEKLGDRVTALQQLVSPFGKTDTASVLHEAIDYIKFLHDQVNVLSTPYMKNGSPVHHRQQMSDKSRNQEGLKEGLKSRGLCLVPISSTFPVAAETTTDFWTPTFGGTFR